MKTVKADIAKPLQDLGAGVFEIALPHRGNAFRVVLCGAAGRRSPGRSCLSKEINQGIKTPKHEIDLIQDRIKRLKEVLR